MDPIYDLCVKGDIDGIRKLNLDKNHLSLKFENGIQSIHLACIHGHLELAKLLVKEGAQINARDDKGMSPLHHACDRGRVDVVRWLMSQKIFKNNRNTDGKSPLLCAAASGHVDVIKVLLSENVFDFIVDNDGNSALHLAYLNGHNDLARYLASSGLDINLKNNAGKFPQETARPPPQSVHLRDFDNQKTENKVVSTSNKETEVEKHYTETKNISPKIQSKILTELKFRLAHDPQSEIAFFTQYTGSWEKIIDEITSGFNILPSQIKAFILFDTNGVALSKEFFCEPTLFWEVFASGYDVDSGMVFEVICHSPVTDSSLPSGSKPAIEVSSSTKSKDTDEVEVATGDSASITKELSSSPLTVRFQLVDQILTRKNINCHPNSSWIDLVALLRSHFQLSKDTIVDHLVLLDSDGDEASPVIINSNSFWKIVLNTYDHDDQMVFILYTKKHDHVPDSVTKTIQDQIKESVEDKLRNSPEEVNLRSKSTEERTEVADESQIEYEEDTEVTPQKSTMESSSTTSTRSMEMEILPQKKAPSTTAVSPSTIIDEKTGTKNMKKTATRDGQSSSPANPFIAESTPNSTETNRSAVSVPVSQESSATPEQGTIEGPQPSSAGKDVKEGAIVKTVAKSKPVTRPKTVLTEIKFVLYNDLSRTCSVFTRYGATWPILTESIAYSLKLTWKEKINRLILSDKSGNDLGSPVSDATAFWEAFAGEYDIDDGMYFRVYVEKQSDGLGMTSMKSVSFAVDERGKPIPEKTTETSAARSLLDSENKRKGTPPQSPVRDIPPVVSVSPGIPLVSTASSFRKESRSDDSTISQISQNSHVVGNGNEFPNSSPEETVALVTVSEPGRKTDRPSASDIMEDPAVTPEFAEVVTDSGSVSRSAGDELGEQTEEVDLTVENTEAVKHSDSPKASLKHSGSLSIKVRLAKEPTRLADVRVLPNFSWGMLIESISGGLELESTTAVQRLALINILTKEVCGLPATNMTQFENLLGIYRSKNEDENIIFEAIGIGSSVSITRGIDDLTLEEWLSSNKSSSKKSEDLARGLNVYEPNVTESYGAVSIRLRLRPSSSSSSSASTLNGPNSLDKNKAQMRLFIPENDTWPNIIAIIKKYFKLNGKTIIDGLILIDAEGDVLSHHIISSSDFWRVIANTYDEEEEMLFEVLVTDPISESITDSQPLDGDTNHMDRWTLRVRLHSDHRKQALIRIQEDITWEGLMKTIGSSLNFTEDSRISWLILTDNDGSPYSSKVTDIEKFRKLCLIRYDCKEDVAYDVFTEESDGVSASGSVSTTSKQEKVSQEMKEESQPKSQDKFNEVEVETTELNVKETKALDEMNTQKSSDNAKENSSSGKLFDKRQEKYLKFLSLQHQHTVDDESDNVENEVKEAFFPPDMGVIAAAQNTVPVKMQMTAAETTTTVINIPENSSWPQILVIIAEKFNVLNPGFIDGVILMDEEGQELSERIRDETWFWKTVANVYDHEENMEFDVLLKPLPPIARSVSQNIPSNFSDDQASIISGLTNDVSEEESYILRSFSKPLLMKPRVQVLPEQQGWLLRVRLHSNPLQYSYICANIDDSWQHITEIINLALNPSQMKEIHRLLLIDTSGEKNLQIITTIEKFRQVLQSIEKENKNLILEVYYEREQEISPLDEFQESKPFSYQSLRLQPIANNPDGTLNENSNEGASSLEQATDDSKPLIPLKPVELTSKKTKNPSKSDVLQMPASYFDDPVERRVLTAIDKARSKLKVVNKADSKQNDIPQDSGLSASALPPVPSTPNTQSKNAAVLPVSETLVSPVSPVISTAKSLTTTTALDPVHTAQTVPMVTLRIRILSPLREETVAVPHGCSWVKLLFTVHTVFNIELTDIVGFILRDEDHEELSPTITTEARFWKVYQRSYKGETKMAYELIITKEAQTKLLAASLAKPLTGGSESWGADVLVRFRLFQEPSQEAILSLPQNCSWEKICNVIKRGLKLRNDEQVDRVLLADTDRDQIIPALKSGTKFWKAVKDSYDADEGMAFEVFVQKIDMTKGGIGVMTPNRLLPGSPPSSPAEVTEITKPMKISVNVRFCLSYDVAKKVEVRVPMGCSWIKLAEAIASVLGPMQASWVQSLVLVDEKGSQMSQLIEDGPTFWKIFTNSFEIQNPNMCFEVNQSLRPAPIGSINSGGFLTTSSGDILGGPDVNCVDPHGLQAIHLATASGNLHMVKWLLKAGCLVDSQDDHGMTALHYACDGKYLEIALELIQAGADLLISNKVGFTPAHFILLHGMTKLVPFIKSSYINLASDSGLSFLHCACDEGSLDNTEYLLSNGAYVDIRDADGMTPLHYSCLHGYAEISQLLIEYGAYINVRDDEGMSPFLYACSDGHLELAEWLVENGASITARNDFGNNALHLACEHGNIQLVNWLIFKGLDNNSRDKDGWTPLHYASKAGHIELAMLLQGTGIDIWVQPHEKLVAQFEIDMTIEKDLRTREEKEEAELIEERRPTVDRSVYPDHAPFAETPLNDFLRESCIQGDLENVRALLGSGASIMCRNHNGSTPLHFACAGGHYEVAALLLDSGADINAFNNSGSTPLHFASDKEFSDLALWMVKQGALPDVKNIDGFTPLHFLCSRGQADVISEIARIHQFDPNLCGHKGINLLHCCSEQGHANVGKVLLELGALVNMMDEDFKTALHYACIRGHVLAVRNLIDGGAYVNVKDISGNTPLFYACAGGYIDLVSKLQGWGAKIDIRNRYGNTCLHSVCLLGQQGMAQWLIENDASLWVENRQGDTPYEYAVTSRNDYLLNWISSRYPDAEFRYRKT